MKLFTPRTPEPPPAGTSLRFYFASDPVVPPRGLPQLADALAAIDAEKARLRSIVAAAVGCSDGRMLQKALAAVITRQDTANSDYTRACSRSDLTAAEEARARVFATGKERSNCQVQLQKIEAAEAAQTALAQLIAQLTR